MRHKIARAKLKSAQEKIEALAHQEEKDKLNLLVEASLQAYSPSTLSIITIFEETWLSF